MSEPLREAVALYAFQEGPEGALAIQKGDALKVIEDVSADWLIAQRPDGARGLVPTTYVKISAARPQAVGWRAQALFDFSNGPQGALLFRKGDILTVITPKEENGPWLRATLNGKEGIVPSNYIQAAAKESSSVPRQQNPTPPQQHNPTPLAKTLMAYDEDLARKMQREELAAQRGNIGAADLSHLSAEDREWLMAREVNSGINFSKLTVQATENNRANAGQSTQKGTPGMAGTDFLTGKIEAPVMTATLDDFVTKTHTSDEPGLFDEAISATAASTVESTAGVGAGVAEEEDDDEQESGFEMPLLARLRAFYERFDSEKLQAMGREIEKAAMKYEGNEAPLNKRLRKHYGNDLTSLSPNSVKIGSARLKRGAFGGAIDFAADEGHNEGGRVDDLMVARIMEREQGGDDLLAMQRSIASGGEEVSGLTASAQKASMVAAQAAQLLDDTDLSEERLRHLAAATEIREEEYRTAALVEAAAKRAADPASSARPPPAPAPALALAPAPVVMDDDLFSMVDDKKGRKDMSDADEGDFNFDSYINSQGSNQNGVLFG